MDGGDAHVSHEFDMALSEITAQNAALSLSLVGHPCHSVFPIKATLVNSLFQAIYLALLKPGQSF